MNIDRILKQSDNIEVYEKGTSVMWTEAYISEQLLAAHINPDNDLASRSKDKIEKVTDWITKSFGREKCDVLDIGCGPGLYTEALAKKGHKVKGIDFSTNSIDYAMRSAKSKSLDIEYRCMNYLELDYDELEDVIIMIYCDFCVLTKQEQDLLLKKVYRALKPGGVFIFDVYNEGFLDYKAFGKTWELFNGGFWRKEAYLDLSLTKHYSEQKIILSQNIILEENNFEIYRFWQHYFSEKDIFLILKTIGFSSYNNCGNILRSKNKSAEDGITFFTAVK